MVESSRQLYEGLFLLNQAAVAGDFGGCVDHLKEILERAGAEILLLKKWEERKLAYEIKGQRRGSFLLAYFHAPGEGLSRIERDCNLSERVIRSLVIRADHVGEVELEVARKDGDLLAETVLREGVERSGESGVSAETGGGGVDAGSEVETGESGSAGSAEPAEASDESEAKAEA